METTVLALGSAPPLSFVAWILIGLTVGVLAVMLVAVSRRETPEDQTRRAYVTAAIAGLVGAVIGGWIITLFGVDAVGGGMYLSMLTGIIGAGVLAWGTTAVGKNRKGAGQVRS
ncbi:GlsB/YeaQ/YmgE family stress response membrane protein [Corynebacterium variabile]|uniref:GlsB/YeaQ/YmgE family stress response membrane protein n=1 Tax=Corynebacterium variabile TaxID=1727 RepID=UPI001D67C6C4|nr:GlsB/YeaQ/YmgE family stress response membrane protein [Corynebacterium variabile]HJG46697.1 GlsB/YeaQ/YmgE family stress response membrane protein [Corynebacterium variabile]